MWNSKVYAATSVVKSVPSCCKPLVTFSKPTEQTLSEDAAFATIVNVPEPSTSNDTILYSFPAVVEDPPPVLTHWV